jgi:hypothetical protein
MRRIVQKQSLAAVAFAAAVIAVGVAASSASTAPKKHDDGYTVHALVSDQAGKANHMDPNLVNSWGITASSTSPWWVADNGMNVSTLYDGNGPRAVPNGAARRFGRGRADRNRLQRFDWVRHQRRERPLGACGLHVRDRGRDDPRLEPERAAAAALDAVVRRAE